MIRRNPTRIVLKLDDLQDYEMVRREQESKKQGISVQPMQTIKTKQEIIQERIGYHPGIPSARIPSIPGDLFSFNFFRALSNSSLRIGSPILKWMYQQYRIALRKVFGRSFPAGNDPQDSHTHTDSQAGLKEIKILIETKIWVDKQRMALKNLLLPLKKTSRQDPRHRMNPVASNLLSSF
ncbi:hypothetical protein J437_LFUL006381 [Ladona fulva]|uniref:Anaphase-promoting complex subunit CDC26 n=1 Tax=Ladona fulva TaxID=123851 RepID=A0A8K0K0P3_LADFU|nr:hypothetical protein J437_LFUL006381 [Ladona fulva]